VNQRTFDAVDNAQAKAPGDLDYLDVALIELDDERLRLEALFQQTHGAHSSWVAEAEKLRKERDLLRGVIAEIRGWATSRMTTDNPGPAEWLLEITAVLK